MLEVKRVIHSKRKTIALQICDDTTLLVRAPFGVGEDVIGRIILKHQRWIEKKRREILDRDVSFTKKKFVNGEEFLYLGQSYRLKIVKENWIEDQLEFKRSCFFLRADTKNPEDAFVDWYKMEAYQKFFERVCFYAETRGFKYNRIKISNARKRWGSCSYSGNLNFSWRLIMAPMKVLDYVVVHELVHLIERNHSKSFWEKVHFLQPDYKKQQEWLKKNGYLLK